MINKILHCDWLSEGVRWSYFAHLGLTTVSRNNNSHKSHIINPVLTKLVQSRCLGLVLFLHVKKNLADIQSSWPRAWSITQLISHNPSVTNSVFCIFLFEHCSIWGSLHVCLFNVIVLLLAISHIRASFSDPGENHNVISLNVWLYSRHLPNLYKRWKIVLDWKIIFRQFPFSTLSAFFSILEVD